MLRCSFQPLNRLHTSTSTQYRKITSSIHELQAAFRDRNSPYHIPDGGQGPEAPDSPAHTYGFNHAALDPLAGAREKLLEQGFDPLSFWEQRIVWGDHDSFQHVNNVRYVRFFESARIRWMTTFGHELGGPEKAEAMIRGQGISLILKSIDVQFRRPVTYPDSLLIGYKPIPPAAESKDPATFEVRASAYSIAQKAFVAHSKEQLVWYDYDQLKKSDPGAEVRNVVFKRASQGS